jgi:DNA mismatch repair ATPase MutS
MKAFLLHRDRDFDLKRPPPSNESDLLRDLELETLLPAMAVKDELVFSVAKAALMAATSNDVETIEYRQAILKDCLRNPDTVRQLYSLAQESFERVKRIWTRFREYPSSSLDDSVARMRIFLDVLRKIRSLSDRHSTDFRSDGFSNLFTTLARELDDEYFALIEKQLNRLNFRNGVFVSAGLGKGLRGENYILRRPLEVPGNWFTRALRSLFEWAATHGVFWRRRPDAYTLYLAPRDEAGARAISELRDRGVALAADALAKSVEHIESFFRMLQTELAFYIGCLNLHQRLLDLSAPFTFPTVSDADTLRFASKDLYDICLALSMNKRPVGNEVEADEKSLIIVTGANQGGKTTFLRSAGLAQLMTQCGMFAPAASLRLSVVDGLFTHFKREEDVTMKSGKFDEELSRMNAIVDALTPKALILFNESFAATNEREGSEIARQIVSALLERSHRVVFVSHQYAFAHGFFERQLAAALFLRADRQPDGRRTFKLVEGEPLSTSFGEDVYREVFSGLGKARADA